MEKTVNHYLGILPEGGQTCFFTNKSQRSVSQVISDQLLEKYLRQLQEQGKIHVREIRLNKSHRMTKITTCTKGQFIIERALVVTKLPQSASSGSKFARA